MGQQKIEAGQVWRWVGGARDGQVRLVTGTDGGNWWLGIDLDNGSSGYVCGKEPPIDLRLISPAPKPGQTWKCHGGGRGDLKIVQAGAFIGIVEGDDDHRPHIDTVVGVAQWLFERGYRCVEETVPELRVGMRVMCDKPRCTGRVVAMHAKFDTIDIEWRFDGNALTEPPSRFAGIDARTLLANGRWAILPDEPAPALDYVQTIGIDHAVPGSGRAAVRVIRPSAVYLGGKLTRADLSHQHVEFGDETPEHLIARGQIAIESRGRSRSFGVALGSALQWTPTYQQIVLLSAALTAVELALSPDPTEAEEHAGREAAILVHKAHDRCVEWQKVVSVIDCYIDTRRS
jgi:hypothetical protein